ncbi:TetR family transcriptional regulator [Micromonospora carbonacea]|uniref:TetR family transcriptional regulator n=1 Tax=Micromonospora carbonacea TaxID=47853 RepID=A0A7H8XKH0_9ACTN|nr:TetR family transcriptional regulator [Micromonospora carbonacea]MBB5825845.1 AcrR family transcriptional regulator [Micromonospora carbonacea]QLD25446.1 TetR family transcriptional regulator [Micromonospora carbonacea]
MASTFQRARTAEQRAERATAILRAARDLLDELPLEAVTLNAIAGRAGFAASNVLRYYDSREAVLLALVAAETETWLTDLLAEPPVSGQNADRCRAVAATVAATMERHPHFCELISVQAAVLERNVRVETTAAFKATTSEQLGRAGDWLLGALPELAPLGRPAVLQFTARCIVIAGALWAHSRSNTRVAEHLGDTESAGNDRTSAVADIRDTLALLFLGATRHERRPGGSARPTAHRIR